MNTRWAGNRALGMLLLVALASAALAPAAAAGRGQVRYKGGGPAYQGRGVVRVVHRGPYFIERHSEAGAIAGFIGGLVVGSVLSSARPAARSPRVYEYYDPYCDRRFVTVGAYDRHLYYHRHPRTAGIIEVHSGHCAGTLVWRDGRWCGRNDRGRDDHPVYEDWDE